MKKIIGLLIICFSNIYFLSAQTNDKKVIALNNYVSYCNETIHALWSVYHEFMELNNDINYYKINNKAYFNFENKDWLGEIYNYEMLPNDVYKKCLIDGKLLENGDERLLNNNLKDLKNTLDSLQILRDTIYAYIKGKKYLNDDGLKIGYQYLETAEKYFINYKRNKNFLFKNVNTIYEKKMKPSDNINRLAFTSIQFRKGIKIVKNLLDDFAKNDTINILKYSKSLDSLINIYNSNEEEFLKGLKRFGSANGNDPFFRYEFVVRNFEAISSHAHHFINYKGRPYGSDSGWPRGYYFYNNNFINKYNRYGLGLIQDYNKFIDLSNIKLLHWVEEPHQYRVRYPEEEKIKKNDLTEKLKIEKDTVIKQENGLEGYADNHLIFLLDVSGSMKEKDKLPLLKDAFKYLLSLMRPQDKVAIISYSGQAKIELNSTSASEKKKIKKALDKLKSNGNTNALDGLDKAYQLAKENYIKNGNNRIILATDGLFELNNVVEAEIKNSAKEIALSIFFFGKTKNKSITDRLNNLSNLGNGNFVEINFSNAKSALLSEARSIKK